MRWCKFLRRWVCRARSGIRKPINGIRQKKSKIQIKGPAMDKGRLEAFSDGVIAILITIMVLELRLPQGTDVTALVQLAPVFLSYTLSFLLLGVYWNNHHHMLQAIEQVDGRVLWANLHLLFWLSLVPFATNWMGENSFATLPVAFYGVLMLFSA